MYSSFKFEGSLLLTGWLVSRQHLLDNGFPDSKVRGANMGPIWGRQDPVGSHCGPMNLAIWVGVELDISWHVQFHTIYWGSMYPEANWKVPTINRPANSNSIKDLQPRRLCLFYVTQSTSRLVCQETQLIPGIQYAPFLICPTKYGHLFCAVPVPLNQSWRIWMESTGSKTKQVASSIHDSSGVQSDDTWYYNSMAQIKTTVSPVR